MKTFTKTLIAAALFAATSVTTTTYAKDITTVTDWKTLAITANELINNKTNLSEAGICIDKSITIRPTSYNLTLKGDYYMLKNQPEKAMAAYITALETGAEEEVCFDTAPIQSRIAAIVAMN